MEIFRFYIIYVFYMIFDTHYIYIFFCDILYIVCDVLYLISDIYIYNTPDIQTPPEKV